MTETEQLPPGVLSEDEAGDLFQRAATGDHEAQTVMCGNVMAMLDAGMVPTWEGLLVAEMYARLAAVSGNPAALVHLAGILLARLNAGKDGPIGDAGPNVSLALQTEIVTLLDQAADEGEDTAATSLNEIATLFSPEAFTIARQLRVKDGERP